VTRSQQQACSFAALDGVAGYSEVIVGRHDEVPEVALPDISNNVGSVKCFLSALRRSLLRVVFLVLV
jgi:hypothetical protein